jgi:hypothetical protein
MANRPINITGIDASTGQLILSDNGSTTVNQNDTVTWNIMNNSGVASITGIVDNSSLNLFSQGPAAQNSSPAASWQGTISSSATPGAEETYTINYTTDNGLTCKHDPVIKINS